jgi:hypothetical protein
MIKLDCIKTVHNQVAPSELYFTISSFDYIHYYGVKALWERPVFFIFLTADPN